MDKFLAFLTGENFMRFMLACYLITFALFVLCGNIQYPQACCDTTHELQTVRPR